MVGMQPKRGQRVVTRWDAVFETLSDEPRRQVVASLLEVTAGNGVALPTAATNPNLQLDSETQRVELHHQHLPEMAERGYIEWETDPFVAYRGPDFEEVATVVKTLQTAADRMPDSLVEGCQQLESRRQSPDMP